MLEKSIYQIILRLQLYFTMFIRRATAADLVDIQNANLQCLPENYTMKYFFYHYLSWPDLIHVQVDSCGKIKGYVLGKIDDAEAEHIHALRRIENSDKYAKSATEDSIENHQIDHQIDSSLQGLSSQKLCGHITSLAVHPSYRKLGIAAELMKIGEKEMHDVYGADFITLHVRRSNAAAVQLYRRKLNFHIASTADRYYGDGEDAFEMIKRLKGGST